MRFSDDPSFFVVDWTPIGRQGIFYRFQDTSLGLRGELRIPFWTPDGRMHYTKDTIAITRGWSLQGVRRMLFSHVYHWETELMQQIPFKPW